MAITPDWPAKTFFIPQGDLTLVTGTLYEIDTENDFRQIINALMASEEGIVFEDPIRHNTEVTVAGTTFARTIEIINGYNITFTPDSQWSVRLAGSNNNLFDVENGVLNQNQVQVIAQNSAGLIKGDISEQIVEGSFSVQAALRIILAALAGKLSGAETATVTFRDTGDTKNRIVAIVDGNGNRLSVTLDAAD